MKFREIIYRCLYLRLCNGVEYFFVVLLENVIIVVCEYVMILLSNFCSFVDSNASDVCFHKEFCALVDVFYCYIN